MHIEWLKRLDEIEAIKGQWLELEASVKNRTVISSYDWIFSWYRHYGGVLGEPLVGVALLDGKLIGIAPFVYWKGTLSGISVRRIDFAGHNSEAGEFLISGDTPDLAGLFLGSLVDIADFDLVCLNGMETGSEMFRSLRSTILKQGLEMEISDYRYAIVDIKEGYEHYYQLIGTDLRKKIKRIKKRMLNAGEVKIERIKSINDNEIQWFMSRMFSIVDSSWKRQANGRPMAECHRHFYTELVSRFNKRKMVDISILSINEEDAAFILALSERGFYYDVSVSYAEKFKNYYPGFYLMQEVLQSLPGSGIHTVVSHGDHEYKKSWATRFVGQNRVFIFSSSLRAYLSRIAKFVVQPKLIHIKEALSRK